MISKWGTYRRLIFSVGIVEGIWWLFTFLLAPLYLNESANFHLLHPEYLWFWLIIPVIFGFSFYQWNWKEKTFAEYSGFGNTRMLWVKFEPLKAFLHYFLLRTCVFFIVFSLAQPVMGSQKVNGSKRVLDLVICLDISNSMNAKDMGSKPDSRLTAAKNAISELLNKLKGERISIVVFANEAYTQLPLTMDYGAAKLFVPDIETSMITDQGTNIGRAFEVAQSQFKDEEAGKAVLVITDGEDHEKLWDEQVKQLKEKNVLVSYLGLGSSKGALIPVDPYDEASGFKREGGQPVVARLDQSSLEKMASKSNGELVVSSSAYPDITSLATSFANAKSLAVKTIRFDVAKNYFHVTVIIALICFLLYLFLPHIVEKFEQ